MAALLFFFSCFSLFFLSCSFIIKEGHGVPLEQQTVADAASSVTLQNSFVTLAFSTSVPGFPLVQLAGSFAPSANLVVSPDTHPLWTLTYVQGQQTHSVTSSAGIQSFSQSGQSILFKWGSVGLASGGSIDVLLNVTLASDSTLATFRLSMANLNTPSTCGLLSLQLLVAGLTANSDDELFFPAGYGIGYPDPLITGPTGISGSYPSSSATMQFLAIGGGASSLNQGAYVGAHDASSSIKTVQAVPSLVTSSYALGYEIIPPNAGLPWSVYDVGFDIAVGVYNASAHAPWYGAAQMYKTWALASASWTQGGKITAQAGYPDWYLNNTLWFNTGWQCFDIFNDTQGDPLTVLSSVTQLQARLNMSFSLHWYEFQQGPDPSPDARYRFDTHYPDYFPPRPYFGSVVTELQAIGVHVFPYINGRIFDRNSTSYLEDNGQLYSCKYPDPSNYGDLNLTMYEESYGSGAVFSVADPSTSYWQGKIADAVDTLVNEYGCGGVYIDQLGAAAPAPDWDPSHNHTLGGGSYWYTGLTKMAATIRSAIGGSHVLVTESNAESLIGSINGFLTLVAFEPPFVSVKTSYLAPAFPSIYGGYYIGFGDVYNANDLLDSDVYAARLGTTFVYGTQLGWFSLGGVTSGPDLDKDCGPMGTFDIWMSDSFTPAVQFMQNLTQSRILMLDYFLYGRLMLPVLLSPPPPTFVSHALQVLNPGPFAGVVSAVWRSDDKNTTCLFVVGVQSNLSYTANITMDMSLYEYPDASLTLFQAFLVLPSGQRTLYQVFSGGVVNIVNLHFSGRQIFMFEIIPMS